MKHQVTGKVVLITGANRGIGKALASVAASSGAKKIYAGARDTKTLDHLIATAPAHIVPIELDVTKAADIDHAARNCDDVEILINNAGINHYQNILTDFNEVSARAEFDVNFFGMLNMCRAFFPVLRRRPSAAILNILSLGAVSPDPRTVTYSASKAAALSMTKVLRAELLNTNISVHAVNAGPIDTDMIGNLNIDFKATPESAAKYIYNSLAEGLEEFGTDDFSAKYLDKYRKEPEKIDRFNQQFANKVS